MGPEGAPTPPDDAPGAAVTVPAGDDIAHTEQGQSGSLAPPGAPSAPQGGPTAAPVPPAAAPSVDQPPAVQSGKESASERRRRERGARRLAKQDKKARAKEERDLSIAECRRAEQKKKSVSPPGRDLSESVPSAEPADLAEPLAGGDQTALHEAAEREAMARLAEAERQSDPERSGNDDVHAQVDEGRRAHEAEQTQAEVQERIDSARIEAEQRPREAAQETPLAAEDSQRAEVERFVPKREALLAELQEAEAKFEEHREQEEELARELVHTEERLSADKQQTADALERAAARLEEVEARAVTAERRAEQAEKIASEKGEEVKRTERLRHMLDRIAEAERRATAAEQRARVAVDRVAEPTPEIDAAAVFDPQPQVDEVESELVGEPDTADGGADASASESPEWFSTTLEPQGPLGTSEAGASGGAVAGDAAPEGPADELADAEAVLEGTGAPVAINTATYEDLRGLGLSVTQTGRLLAARQRTGSFQTLDELDGIPGFPSTFLDQLKEKLTL